MPRVSKYSIRLKQVALCAIVLLCLFYGRVYALGLGKLEVQSNLDEVLKLKIELITNNNEDLNEVEAVIASREDFLKVGAFYPEYLKTVRIQIVNDGGSPHLLMTSKQIIKEPFIHFLVRVNWSGGSLLREYTALIDPPVYAAEAPQPVVTPRVVDRKAEPKVTEVDNNRYEEDLSDDNVSELQQTPDASYESETSNLEDVDAAYGPVESGETLSEIAAGLQQQFPELSMYQIMYVLFEENRSAFIDDNINGLLKGAVLKISSISKIKNTTMSDATGLFTEHVARWQANTGYIAAEQTQELKVSQEEDTIESFDNEVIPEVDEDEQQISDDIVKDDTELEEVEQDVVEVVDSETAESEAESFVIGSSEDTQTGSAGGSNEGEVLALESEISELQASVESSELEKSELRERVNLLEAQLEEVNRLMAMEVEDAELASLQNSQNVADDEVDAVGEEMLEAEDSLAEVADENIFGDDNVGDESQLAEVADEFEEVTDDEAIDSDIDDGDINELQEVDEVSEVEEGASDGLIVGEGVDEQQITEEEVQSETESRVMPVEPEPEPIQKTVVDVSKTPADFAKSESFLDTVLSSISSTFDAVKKTFKNLNPGILSGGNNFTPILGGFGVLLLSILGLVVYRNKKALEEFEISMMSIGSDSQISSRSANVERGSPSSSLESSFLTVYSESKGVVHADEIDPVAEADVYIAYGRDEQAEEVLKEGIQKYPARTDIKLKLLKLYKRNKDTTKFERLAEELYPTDDSGSKVWQKVVSMGKTLSPNNPLFASDIADMTNTMSENKPNPNTKAIENDDFTKTAVLKTAVLPKADDEASDTSVSNTIAADDFAEDILLDDEVNVDEINASTNTATIDAVETDAVETEVNEINLDDDNQISFDTDGLATDVSTIDNSTIEGQSATQSINQSKGDNNSTTLDMPADDNAASAAATLELNLKEVNLEFEDDQDKQDDIEISVVDEHEDIDLNLQSSEVGDDAFSELSIEVENGDDASTQIELAKVFIDLGDSDGAKKILNEIIEDGNSDQKADAEILLATIK